MDTEIDWRRELDASFGSAPDEPAGRYVVAGHRAVRRRRALTTAVGVVAATVVAGVVWSLSPGSASRGADAPVASDGPAPTQAEAEAEAEARAKREARLEKLRRANEAHIDFLGNPAALTEHGLVMAQGAGPVLERVANPMRYTAEQGSSIGIRVMFEGRERYSLMTWTTDGATSTQTNDASGAFDAWLAIQVSTQRTLDVASGVTASTGDTSDGPWLSLSPSGAVQAARSGIVVVEERTGVDLGPTFAGASDRTGAVRLLVDGRSEFAAYRVIDSGLDVIPGAGSFDSLSAFLDWARAQYASGQGLR